MVEEKERQGNERKGRRRVVILRPPKRSFYFKVTIGRNAAFVAQISDVRVRLANRLEWL